MQERCCELSAAVGKLSVVGVCYNREAAKFLYEDLA